MRSVPAAVAREQSGPTEPAPSVSPSASEAEVTVRMSPLCESASPLEREISEIGGGFSRLIEGCGVRHVGGTVGMGRRGSSRNPASPCEAHAKPMRRPSETLANNTLFAPGLRAAYALAAGRTVAGGAGAGEVGHGRNERADANLAACLINRAQPSIAGTDFHAIPFFVAPKSAVSGPHRLWPPLRLRSCSCRSWRSSNTLSSCAGWRWRTTRIALSASSSWPA